MTKELDIFYAFLEDYADFMEGLSDQEDGKYAALCLLTRTRLTM
ncbi:hypothetical protein [Neglectibacter timonensis]